MIEIFDVIHDMVSAIGRKSNYATCTIKTSAGTYEVTSSRIPERIDKIILYFLISLHYKNKSYSITTNRYEIAKQVFPGVKIGRTIYDRINKSLATWTSISIDFEGKLPGEKNKIISSFPMIKSIIFNKESGELIITFNETYFKHQDYIPFFKRVSFDEFRIFHKDSSALLYENLIKNIKENNEWAIGVQELARKLMLKKRERALNHYVSDVLRYLNPAVNEINKKTDLKIDFNCNEEMNTFIFKVIKK